jgi:hypothetical protein
VAKVKAFESNAGYDSELEPERGRQIIDAEPNATIDTTKLQPGEPNEPEEGECLFHSQMWVKGTPLHFIVDRGSYKPHTCIVFQSTHSTDNATPISLHYWMTLPRK